MQRLIQSLSPSDGDLVLTFLTGDSARSQESSSLSADAMEGVDGARTGAFREGCISIEVSRWFWHRAWLQVETTLLVICSFELPAAIAADNNNNKAAW